MQKNNKYTCSFLCLFICLSGIGTATHAHNKTQKITPETKIFSTTDPITKNFHEHSLAAEQKMFDSKFKIYIPAVKNNTINSKYACPMRGKNISPELVIKGIPGLKSHKDVRDMRLHIVLQDGNCTWGCNSQGKFNHWVADFPVKAMHDKSNKKLFSKHGLKINAANNPKFKHLYTKYNGLGQKIYMGPCAPVGQPHAYLFLGVAYYYDKNQNIHVIGKTQSVPFIYGNPKEY